MLLINYYDDDDDNIVKSSLDGSQCLTLHKPRQPSYLAYIGLDVAGGLHLRKNREIIILFGS